MRSGSHARRVTPQMSACRCYMFYAKDFICVVAPPPAPFHAPLMSRLIAPYGFAESRDAAHERQRRLPRASSTRVTPPAPCACRPVSLLFNASFAHASASRPRPRRLLFAHAMPFAASLPIVIAFSLLRCCPPPFSLHPPSLISASLFARFACSSRVQMVTPFYAACRVYAAAAYAHGGEAKILRCRRACRRAHFCKSL